MGGWCFQLNGLFHWLLAELGFKVVMTGTSSRTAEGEWRSPKDHMALIARIEGKDYLVDVGYGRYKVLYDHCTGWSIRLCTMFCWHQVESCVLG